MSIITIAAVVVVAMTSTSSYLAHAVADCAAYCPTTAATCTMQELADLPYPLSYNQVDMVEACLQSGSACGCDPCAPTLEKNACSNVETCFWVPGGGCVSRDKMCIRFSNNKTLCNEQSLCAWEDDNTYCVFSTPIAPSPSLVDCPPMHPFAVAMIVLIFITLVGMVLIIGIMIVLRNRARAEEERLDEERDAEAAIQVSKRPASMPNTARTVSHSPAKQQDDGHYSGGGYAAPPHQNSASADDLDIDAGGGGEEEGGEEAAAAADAGGYYDEEGNWIATDGSYDPNAYGYDENGNYVGGDGADQGGYYDEEGNWVATEGGGAEGEEEDF